MSNSRILLCKPKMSESELDEIKFALAEDWAVPLGPDCDAFEHELEIFVGENKKVAALVSGTAALHLALIACGVKPGDEGLFSHSLFVLLPILSPISARHRFSWIPKGKHGTYPRSY